ncbi:MAG: response regulator [Bryobacterales bacterium]|jgi:two-component system chemotaxis response regulator CheY|nr:response regulator [Bryobacterales bacterium]
MSLKVLIVDDSPLMRRFVERVLRMSGLELAECREATDGLDALAKIRESVPDIVLTDINMPTMDGESLIRCISEDSTMRDIPVIVISTDRTEFRMSRLMELGAKGYVAKPFNPEVLRAQLERVLGMQASA